MSRLKLPSIPSSQITSETVWRSRRRWLQQAGLGAVAMAGGALWHEGLRAEQVEGELPATLNPAYSLPDMPTSEKDITSYNNFYEFGTGKTDPLKHAAGMQTRPWTLSIEGEVAKPFTIDLDDLLKLAAIEERIYRLRCVEAWSMVIPWNGYALSHLLKRAEPTGNAKFVQFVTATQPEHMPGLRSRIIDWPYLEGLRMDEAMHPLTMLVLGVYGKLLPNQNGAPVRLAVPWKYGFKSGKSLVKIRVLDHMPETSWAAIAPNEYGFYANVNPTVAHPRWSQATERRIGDGFFAPRVETRMFNGYAEQVASLYTGMDLARYY